MLELCLFVLTFSLSKDWLISTPDDFPAVTWDQFTQNGTKFYKLSNGLISRTFITYPNFGTVGYTSSLSSPTLEILRRLSPEAIIGLNGVNYNIGGNSFDFNNTNLTSAYIEPQWIKNNDNFIPVGNNTFIFDSISKVENTTSVNYEWTPGTRHSPKYLDWPPLGLSVEITFKPPSNAPSVILNNIIVIIRYEMYQGMPILSKQIKVLSLNPNATSNVLLSNVNVEILGVNVPFSPGSNNDAMGCNVDYSIDSSNMISYSGLLWLENDIAHGSIVNWYDDPLSQNVAGSYQPMVSSMYNNGASTSWGVRLAPNLPGTMNGVFVSYKNYQIIFDSIGDMERNGLARRQLMHRMSGSSNENPIFAEATNLSEPALKSFIDQCNETGFEMLIFSFGSGFDLETNDSTILNYYKNIIEYAASKNIEMGGYDLIVLDRNISSSINVIDINGNEIDDACLATNWYNSLIHYFNNYINIGMKMILTDGPYGGELCYSNKHEYHDNGNDSVFRQLWLQNEFYKYYKNQSIFIHSPDNYYYYGSDRSGMGYNEDQYSLPRWQDLMISRQGMYDDTFTKITTQGWMFLPLTPYHSNNPDCYWQPLDEHIKVYDFALGQYFGYGVMSTMRGTKLYDTNSTKSIVIKWVNFYKLHRDILISDIIHIRRPDYQNIDAILHVNSQLKECGLLVIYNQLENNDIVNQTLNVNLYYTGVKNQVKVSYQDEAYILYNLDNLYFINLNVTIKSQSITYFVFQNV